MIAAVVVGLPVLFLLASGWLGLNTDPGRALLAEVALPEGAAGYLPFMLDAGRGTPTRFC